jgi:hypothetical protein
MVKCSISVMSCLSIYHLIYLIYLETTQNFLAIAVQPVSVDFLRHFIQYNKLHSKNFIIKYGDYVSLPANRCSIWQFFGSRIDTHET